MNAPPTFAPPAWLPPLRVQLTLLVVLLWGITLLGPLAVLLDGRAAWLSLAALGLAAVSAAIGVWRRDASMMLVTFPLLLTMAVAALPQDARDAVLAGARWWPWATVLVALVIRVSAAADESQAPLDVSIGPLQVAGMDAAGRQADRVRQALVPLLLLAPAFVLLMGGVQADASGRASALDASVVMAMSAALFAWSIGVWLFFLGPAQFSAWEHVGLRRRLAGWRRPWLRPAAWLTLATALLVVAWWW